MYTASDDNPANLHGSFSLSAGQILRGGA